MRCATSWPPERFAIGQWVGKLSCAKSALAIRATDRHSIYVTNFFLHRWACLDERLMTTTKHSAATFVF